MRVLSVNDNFSKQKYLIRRKILKFIGASFHIYDMDGNLMFFVGQKGFKLKEDLRIYSDESKSNELLLIKARNIIDFSPIFDVYDSTEGNKIGAFKRKGMRSMLRDEWEMLDANDQVLGVIFEDSMGLALVRRFLTALIPQHFDATINDKLVWTFDQNFNPFVQKISLDMTHDTEDLMDDRLGIAAAVLLCAIEGQQA